MSFIHSVLNTIRIHSPQILTGMAITTAVGASVAAAVSTPKAVKAYEEYKEHLNIIQNAKNDGKTINGDIYTNKDYRKENFEETMKHLGKQTLIYLPSIILLGVSGASSLGALKIMNGRVAGLTATVGTLTAALASAKAPTADAYTVKLKDSETGKTIEKTVADVDMFKEDEASDEENKIHILRLDTSVKNSPLLSPYAVKIPKSNPNIVRCGDNDIYVSHWLDNVQEVLDKTYDSMAFRGQKIYLIDVLKKFDITPDTDVDHSINWDMARVNGWLNCSHYINYAPGTNSKDILDYTGDRFISCGYRKDQNEKYTNVVSVVRDQNNDIYLDFNCFGNILYLKPLPLTKDEKIEYLDGHDKTLLK